MSLTLTSQSSTLPASSSGNQAKCVKDDVIPGGPAKTAAYIIPPLENKYSTSDYVFYFIDIIASIVAISLAMIATSKQDYTMRILHVVFAIMLRYFYLGYIILRLISGN